ncbi:MAG: hypothetical protein WCV62_03055 [Candidatus Peribacteraceae bacterium]|jgi:hypothetical protein
MHIALLQHRLVRQIGGAAAGALIAFLLYGAYEWGGPRVASLFATATANGGTESRVELVVERARERLEMSE